MRTWNLRLNVDEFNELFIRAFTDQDKADMLQGLAMGINGSTIPEQCSKVVRTSFEVGLGWRREAEGFKERMAEGGKASAAARKAKFGSAQPSEHCSKHLPNLVRTNLQSTIHNPLTEIPKEKEKTSPSARLSPEEKERIEVNADEILRSYPRKTSKGEGNPRPNRTKLILRLTQLTARFDLDELLDAWAWYLDDWTVNRSHSFIKAPDNFFGPQGPWEDCIRESKSKSA